MINIFLVTKIMSRQPQRSAFYNQHNVNLYITPQPLCMVSCACIAYIGISSTVQILLISVQNAKYLELSRFQKLRSIIIILKGYSLTFWDPLVLPISVLTPMNILLPLILSVILQNSPDCNQQCLSHIDEETLTQKGRS